MDALADIPNLCVKAGNAALGWLSRVFGSRNERMLKEMVPIVERVCALEGEMQRLPDAALRAKTAEFRERHDRGKGESLDDLLPEAFAVVREAARRVMPAPNPDNPYPMMRHFDVQIMGGIVLHRGTIAEMVTGEGKTLVATCAAYLNSLAGKGVHIVTTNDYLAKRDCEWMHPMYHFMGIRAGYIQAHQDYEQKRVAYECDITFGTNSEFGFDYLRDNMRGSAEEQVQKQLHYAIIDEVDSILIDEARTPLIISGPAEDSTDQYYRADRIARKLKRDTHFEVKEKEQSANLTDDGIEKVQELLGVDSIYTGRNMDWPHLLEQALRAHHLYKRDVDYVAKGNEIVIVDEFTGRLMDGRRWSDGLHQAVEAKEHIKIKQENQTLATITYQNFFRLYDKISGMTGTALTEATEFDKIYKLDVVVIPTHRPLIRKSYPDVVFRTAEEKWQAIVDEIMSVHRTGRPILVGTTSIENSEMLSERLGKRGIKHDVLNAKQHAREAQIVAKAGQMRAVTIATNMAGRGTDIVLGPGVADLCGIQTMPTLGRWNKVIDKVDKAMQSDYHVYWGVEGRTADGRTVVGQPRRLKFVDRLPEDTIEDEEPSVDGAEPGEDEIVLLHPKEDEQIVPENRIPTFSLRAGRSLSSYQLQFSLAGDFGQSPPIARCPKKLTRLGDKVFKGGGLHIVGTERHDARRIDNQLRGRSGRQGDPGSSRFFLSLEDDLMRIFASERVSAILKRFGMEEGMAIEHGMVSRSIERAQRKVEERHFEARKWVLDFDEVMNEQRKTVYAWRQAVLSGESLRSRVWEMVEDSVRDAADFYHEARNEDGERNFAGLAEWFQERFGRSVDLPDPQAVNADELGDFLLARADEAYKAKEAEMGPETMRKLERFLLLDKIDIKWKDHLYGMDHLKDGISFRGYAQVDPKIEYKRESLKAFDAMLESIRDEVTGLLFKIHVEVGMEDDRGRVYDQDAFLYDEFTGFDAQQQAAIDSSQVGEEKPEPIRADDKIPRNAPCPCGSGRKYKKCCGQ